MGRVLGLDIGTNSIGWTLIDEREDSSISRVVAIGVRIFPEGVNRDTQGAEHSKNEERRIARGMRRQIARRARRKAVLRRSLVAAGLLPADREAQQRLDELDPYELRRAGLTRRLELHEFGRVLVHLNQRRGFLSNRKADRGRKSENSQTLQEINALAEAMGERTLGEHLAERRQENSQERIRGQHTRRQMYLDEFRKLWEEQSKHHPELTETLCYGLQGPEQTYPRAPQHLKDRRRNSLLREYGLYGILFFQRSLYWPKSVIGRCELTGEKRCPRADRVAQRFRMLNEVNNLLIISEFTEPRALSVHERTVALKALTTKKERTFDELRKALGLLDSDVFNLERADRKKLLGSPIDVALAHKSLFGKRWEAFPEETKDRIVRSLIADEEEQILGKARADWSCSEELARRLIEFDPSDLADGSASYSRAAMERLLPHLERGLRLMGNDATDSALHAAGFLRPDEKVVQQSNQLPPVPDDIRNPIVRQALFEVRKLIHAVIREYGKPDRIHVELAREAKGTADSRAKQTRDMRENERRRDGAAEWLREHGVAVTRDSIQRFLLWREQGEDCVYSGNPISPAQLFGGEVDIDHVLPYSKSLDNSLMNKVVAFRSENTRKGQRTPYEWLSGMDQAKYEQVLQRARTLPFPKRRRFAEKEVKLDDFLARQLSDTAYITTCVRQYLMRLGVDIVCTKGAATAELRYQWGLNTVLRDDGLDLKSRDDHRHHAVDALVIALTSRSRLQQLARTRGADREQLPPPWPKFREQVLEMVDGIKVSHRPARKISGALHEDTIYGPTQKSRTPSNEPRPHAQGWVEEPGTFVVRKPVTALTPAMIDEIRDPHVRELVVARLRERGIDHKSAGVKFPKDLWAEPLWLVPKSGRKSVATHPIRFVRVLRRDQTIQPIRGGTACVKPGSTHHICLFELPGHTPERPKREMIAVTMLEVVQRRKRREPLIRHFHPTVPEAKFLYSLSWGETVWANIRGREDLYVFRTAASTQGQIYFVSHTDARPSATAMKYAVKANTLDAVKVTVDPLGRIRNAND
jgi:CRISPR-associated endonuclease Csn1